MDTAESGTESGNEAQAVDDALGSYAILARELDNAYRSALDRMQARIIETDGINAHVGALLDRGYVEIIPFGAEIITSPRELFVALADALAQKVLPEIAHVAGRGGWRTRDLIVWDEPAPTSLVGGREYLLGKIEYARAQSLLEFLRRIVIRFNPNVLPGMAIRHATDDLVATFAVETAMGTAIPVRRGHEPAIIRMLMTRHGDDPMWQVLQRHHGGIVRGANALATMAMLKKEMSIATSMSDMLNQMDVQLAQTSMRYEAGQAFHGGGYMRLALQRDGADFHLGPSVYELLREVVAEHCPDVLLVQH